MRGSGTLSWAGRKCEALCSGRYNSLLADPVRPPCPHPYTPGLLLQWPLPSTRGQARTPGLLSGCGAAAAPHSHNPPPPPRPGRCTWDRQGDRVLTPPLTASCRATQNVPGQKPQALCLLSTRVRRTFTYMSVSVCECRQSKNHIILHLPKSHREKGTSEQGGHAIGRDTLSQHPGYPSL